MKKSNIVLTEEQRTQFKRLMELCDKYKYSWFWGDNGNARRRTYIENRDYLDYETTVNGVKYDIGFSVRLSRKNVYVCKYVAKDDKRTTARVIRTLLEKDSLNVA